MLKNIKGLVNSGKSHTFVVVLRNPKGKAV